MGEVNMSRHDIVVTAGALVLGAAIWEAVGRIFHPEAVPPFTSVVAAFGRQLSDGEITSTLGHTLGSFGIGLGISLGGGLVIGALMGLWRPLRQALSPFVSLAQWIPAALIAPVYFAIFQLSMWTEIVVVIHFAVFVVIINTQAAFEATDAALLEMARSFGADGRQAALRIRLPAALPMIFAGLRVGAGRAVKGVIVGELYLGILGLGGVVDKYGQEFDATNLLAVCLVILIMSLIVGALTRAVERRFTRWAD
ncbi:MAG TPA: ABC transporter permease subunit [Trebonia sp.]|nr:ABC transporter permease subunit [Trebonia sp.]